MAAAVFLSRYLNGPLPYVKGGGGVMLCLCPPPTFNPTFSFSTQIICLYNTDK